MVVEPQGGAKVEGAAGRKRDRRLFDSHFLKCCGGFDRLGWSTCCLGTWCPCFAVGQNMTRTTGNKLSGVGYGILHFILVIALLGISCTIGAFGLKYYLNCHSTMGCTTIQKTKYNRDLLLLGLGLYLTWVLMVMVSILRRQLIRGIFDVEHEGESRISQYLDDWWAAWCFPCSICQETRTLVLNRVEEGLWKGPEGMQIPSLQEQFP